MLLPRRSGRRRLGFLDPHRRHTTGFGPEERREIILDGVAGKWLIDGWLQGRSGRVLTQGSCDQGSAVDHRWRCCLPSVLHAAASRRDDRRRHLLRTGRFRRQRVLWSRRENFLISFGERRASFFMRTEQRLGVVQRGLEAIRRGCMNTTERLSSPQTRFEYTFPAQPNPRLDQQVPSSSHEGCRRGCSHRHSK